MKSRLGREIALALALKAAVLAGLWWAFFSHPQDKNMDAAQAGAALLGTGCITERIPSPLPSPACGRGSQCAPSARVYLDEDKQ